MDYAYAVLQTPPADTLALWHPPDEKPRNGNRELELHARVVSLERQVKLLEDQLARVMALSK